MINSAIWIWFHVNPIRIYPHARRSYLRLRCFVSVNQAGQSTCFGSCYAIPWTNLGRPAAEAARPRRPGQLEQTKRKAARRGRRWKTWPRRGRSSARRRRTTTTQQRILRSGWSRRRVARGRGKTRPRHCFSVCARNRPHCMTRSGGTTAAAVASAIERANQACSTMRKSVSRDHQSTNSSKALAMYVYSGLGFLVYVTDII